MVNQVFTGNGHDPSSKSNQVLRLPEIPRWSRLISEQWSHQKDAIKLLGRYLAMGEVCRKHAALIRMPTGTGKTGIMAVLANYFSRLNIDNVVIIAPSEFLTEQISNALNCDFWLAVKGRPEKGSKPCVKFLPSTLEKTLAVLKGNPAVYVCTSQALDMLHRNFRLDDADPFKRESWTDAYLELRRRTNLVLVDEGHREPAKEWAKAVRSFSLPTILFTATPYRNDLRFFRVGPEDGFRYTFRFQEAVERRIIRDVSFKDDEHFGGRPERFVDALVRYFSGDFQSQIPASVKSPKVIVRCENFETLRQIKNLLVRKLKDPKKVLAVHDKFPENDNEKQEFHDVPIKHPATFWVHQFKLTEGLDNPDFCLLAFFEPFANSRGLVQQIGRVLRNPGLREQQFAVVLSDRSYGLQEQWQGYLAFEQSKRSLVGPEEIVERFLKSLPDWFYAGGRYRQAADFKSPKFDDESLWDDLRLRKSASVYRVRQPFGQQKFEMLLEKLSEELEEQDMIEVRNLPIKRERGLLGAIMSWKINQTEALAEGGFYNVSFVPSVLYAHNGYLFHSGPIGLAQLDQDDILIKLTPNEMEKLLGSRPTIKQVSLISCDLSDAAVRRKSLGARSIAGVAPGLSDHFHFVSTAVGTFFEGDLLRRRYLGLSKGRVSEAEESEIDVEDFRDWAQQLAHQLKKNGFKTPAVFNRFAQAIPSPKTAQAAHLLLDLVEFFEAYGDRPDDIFEDTFEATACDVEPDGTFTCDFGGKQIRGSVTYSKPRKGSKRFVLKSGDLDEMFRVKNPQAGGKMHSASAYFNHRGVMRIVTTDRHLYADRHFYAPRIPLWGKRRLDNLELLFGLEELTKVKTEKGPEGQIGRQTWANKSIFRVIDKNKHFYTLGELEPHILICEDMGTEYADFIAVDLKHNRVALIHAKQCKGGLSAGDLHILNSQVTKNLEFLNPTGSVGPERGHRWNQLWKWVKTDRANKGLKRIRYVPAGMPDDGASIFELVQNLIRRPSTEKEVWMVLGNGFSIKEFTKELDKDKPPYHVVHLAYLLQSCNANVSSVGARLRVFTCP